MYPFPFELTTASIRRMDRNDPVVQFARSGPVNFREKITCQE